MTFSGDGANSSKYDAHYRQLSPNIIRQVSSLPVDSLIPMNLADSAHSCSGRELLSVVDESSLSHDEEIHVNLVL